MAYFDVALATIGIVLPVGMGALFAYYTRHLLWLRLEVGHNSNARVSEAFLRLLENAKSEMLICDDGNKMEGSIYDNDEIVATVRSKLESNNQFRIRCLFSENYRSKFRAAFENRDYNVEIKAQVERRPVHYKIIDRGQSGYLSRHERGETQRAFKFYENASGWVRELALARHVADIDREFQNAV